MANHLPDKRHLGAIAQFSCDLLAAAVRGDPSILNAEVQSDASRLAYDLAQEHIERCDAIYEAATNRAPQALAQQ